MQKKGTVDKHHGRLSPHNEDYTLACLTFFLSSSKHVEVVVFMAIIDYEKEVNSYSDNSRARSAFNFGLSFQVFHVTHGATVLTNKVKQQINQ